MTYRDASRSFGLVIPQQSAKGNLDYMVARAKYRLNTELIQGKALEQEYSKPSVTGKPLWLLHCEEVMKERHHNRLSAASQRTVRVKRPTSGILCR